MFPAAPPFKGPLRLAQLADVPRIAVVAAASFFHSSWFTYERPYFEKYPRNTLSSYRDSFRKAILDPDSIVLVEEDDLDRSEINHVYDALARAYPPFEEQIPIDGLSKGKAAVSVASFSLLPCSQRSGQFRPDVRTDDPVSSRDKDLRSGKIFDETLHPEEVAAFKGRMVIDMMDDIGLGVAGAPMGRLLFSHIGFKELKTVEIPGLKPTEAGLCLAGFVGSALNRECQGGGR